MTVHVHTRCVASLRGRNREEVLNKWHEKGYKAHHILPFLEIIASHMDYPNCFLLPDDSLHDFVNDDSYPFSIQEVLDSIERVYPGFMSEFMSDTEPSFEPDATIYDLAERVQVKSKTPQYPDPVEGNSSCRIIFVVLIFLIIMACMIILYF